MRLNRQHRLLQVGRAALDAVHVDGGLGERAEVELRGRGRVGRPGALARQLLGPGGELSPAGELRGRRRRDPGPERLGRAAVLRKHRGKDLIERVQSVQRRAAEDARVKVAAAGVDAEVEVDEPARGEVEERHAALEHAGVEDHARVAAALVGFQVLDDRVAAGLLLAVAADPQVDGQLAAGAQLLRRLQEHEELALVVGDAASVEPFVAKRRFERVGLPQLERRRRLDVEVPVTDDGRRVAVAR